MPFIVTEPKIQYVLRYKTITNPEIKELFESINVTTSSNFSSSSIIFIFFCFQQLGRRIPYHQESPSSIVHSSTPSAGNWCLNELK